MTFALFRRRRYLIKTRFQMKFTLLILFWLSVLTVAIGSWLYLGIWSEVIPEFSEAKLAEKLEIASRLSEYEVARYGRQAHPGLLVFREAKLLSAHEQDAVARILETVNARLLPKLLLLLVLVCAASIVISHRVAGPLYHLERALRRIGEGDLTLRITLRKQDELKDLATLIEQTVRMLRDRLTTMSSTVQLMTDDLARLSRMSGQPDDARLLASLRAQLTQLHTHLAAFKLQ